MCLEHDLDICFDCYTVDTMAWTRAGFLVPNLSSVPLAISRLDGFCLPTLIYLLYFVLIIKTVRKSNWSWFALLSGTSGQQPVFIWWLPYLRSAHQNFGICYNQYFTVKNVSWKRAIEYLQKVQKLGGLTAQQYTDESLFKGFSDPHISHVYNDFDTLLCFSLKLEKTWNIFSKVSSSW